MRRFSPICTLGMILLSASAFGQQPADQNRKQAREKWLAEMLQEPVERRILVRPVIRNEKMAVAIAEAYAFSVYGEKQIKEQRPYHVELINGYWVIYGRLPEPYDVGGFLEIVLDAKDGRVVRFLHSK
ncbi:NTF2 fold immunity protein [Hymenobacter sp. B81]|uniref:NTF2 fold immunity protein n=1 Tax=Hymenobacter sp. B81 TaxID=3344878 RepID=UPI0037DC93B7